MTIVSVTPSSPEGVSVKKAGPRGRAATVAIGIVTTGAPGSAAAVENSGTEADAVLDFTIPQGPNGPIGINWRGAWANVATYAARDGVHYMGSAWIALAASTGVLPGTDASRWSILMDGSGAAADRQAAQSAAGFAAGSASDASGYAQDAEQARDDAEEAAAGLNLPSLTAADALRFLRVNAAGDGYQTSNLPDATTAAKGVVELATQAEVDAGTDTTRALSPATAPRMRQIGSTVTISAAVAAVTFTGLNINDAIVDARLMSHNSGSNASINLEITTDNGATWQSLGAMGAAFPAASAINYLASAIGLNAGAATIRASAIGSAVPSSATLGAIASSEARYVGDPINGIRISASAGQLDAGTVKLFGRR
ncbi:hypothetical protein [Antarcticirhabdus aurantiaca]|uniref:Uncharacterized protein n=1 Tax=Antarcticirhabdus aurantiaca TaxID=2606717 RepID=A0ACD4NK49_9HYPH|nr:hypothetical protein [Antarcticirhabdus aurantiaca]WAJ27139.1 hypothetical protein OXU80_20115 [Jeongeuplla avenae]